jgi:pilus assembly protein CpaB
MSMRVRVLLACVCALVGVASSLAYGASVRDEAERVRTEALERFGGEVAQIVVAKRTIEAGELVDEHSVALCDWATDLVPEQALLSLDDVLGRELRVAVAQGVPLTELNFREETALSEVPQGHVAVSIPVSDSLGVSRGVERGTQLCAYAVSDEGPRLISGNVEVLSELSSGQGALLSQQLTIAVLPGQVIEVLSASARGELRLVVPADDVGLQEGLATPGEGGQEESVDDAGLAPNDSAAGEPAGADAPDAAGATDRDRTSAEGAEPVDKPQEIGLQESEEQDAVAEASAATEPAVQETDEEGGQS